MLRRDIENNERSRIVSGDINFTGLIDTSTRHDNFQRMSIAYSMPEAVRSDIAEIENAKNFSEEEKQQYIEEKLLNETNFHGYFFEQTSSMCYRHLCLEMYDDNLDTYIRTEAIQHDFQWTLLQDLCCQLVDSITWLHQNNIYYDGRLHPRNIFVKRTVVEGRTILKLRVPDKINPFNNLDEFYSSFWSANWFQNDTQDQYRIKKDMTSLVFLVYFIQSAGYHLFQVFQKREDEEEHPDWPDNKNEDSFNTLKANIENNRHDVTGLKQLCFCVLENDDGCENEMSCKQRFWINSLAEDWIESMLSELFRRETSACYSNSSGTLKKHPFFWKIREILNFIERSSNYLKESGVVSSALTDFDVDQALLSNLKQNYPSIIGYLSEPPPPPPNSKRPLQPKQPKCISDFGTLLQQIRNKSSHWNEHRSDYKQGAMDELSIIEFAASPDNEMNIFPVKYCLFWMCNFPSLLLETWRNFKNDVSY